MSTIQPTRFASLPQQNRVVRQGPKPAEVTVADRDGFRANFNIGGVRASFGYGNGYGYGYGYGYGNPYGYGGYGDGQRISYGFREAFGGVGETIRGLWDVTAGVVGGAWHLVTGIFSGIGNAFNPGYGYGYGGYPYNRY